MLIDTPTVDPAELNMSVPAACLDVGPMELTSPAVEDIDVVGIFPFRQGRSGGPKPTYVPVIGVGGAGPGFPDSLKVVAPGYPGEETVGVATSASEREPLVYVLPGVGPGTVVEGGTGWSS